MPEISPQVLEREIAVDSMDSYGGRIFRSCPPRAEQFLRSSIRSSPPNLTGRCPNGFLGLSLKDRTIRFLVILLDETVSVGQDSLSITTIA